MSNYNLRNQNSFIYPYRRYYDKVKPENLVFNANLQEFAQRVMILADLETAGKLSSDEVYEQIQSLWEELKRSKEGLKIVTDDH